ncbi:MAG: iron ABC transporter permease [Pseudomonadota bacterium]|nr:iron ABC transporter permease [Pseudomonadota bacterium]
MTMPFKQPSATGYHQIRIGRLEMRLHIVRSVILVLATSGLIAGVFWAITLGSQDILPAGLIAVMSGDVTLSPTAQAILTELRLPRVVLAVLCGAMLGLSGASMQSLTRNGLADPGLLGVREGSIMVILCLTLFGPSLPAISYPVLGTIGGLMVAAMTVAIARSTSNLRFVLIGIGLSWFLSALVAMILVSLDASDAQPLLLWVTGSLASATWDIVPVAAGLLLVNFVLLLGCTRASDVMSLGAQTATGLGVRLGRTSAIQLLAATMLSATCVSTIGGIGFIGLIAPHLTKLVIGNHSQASVLAASALVGGLLLLASDTIGRVAFLPLQLPAGIVLAVIGVPVLLILLWKRRDEL